MKPKPKKKIDLQIPEVDISPPPSPPHPYVSEQKNQPELSPNLNQDSSGWMQPDMSYIYMVLKLLLEKSEGSDVLFEKFYEQFHTSLCERNKFFVYVAERDKKITEFFKKTFVNFPVMPPFPMNLTWPPASVFNDPDVITALKRQDDFPSPPPQREHDRPSTSTKRKRASPYTSAPVEKKEIGKGKEVEQPEEDSIFSSEAESENPNLSETECSDFEDE